MKRKDPRVPLQANLVPNLFELREQTGSSILTGQSARNPGCGPLFAGAVESYPAGGVLPVAESAADTFDLFDLPVIALGAGIGDAGLDERVDFGPPGVDGGGQGEQLRDLAVDTPGEESV